MRHLHWSAVVVIALTIPACRARQDKGSAAKDVTMKKSSFDGKTIVGSFALWTYAPDPKKPTQRCWYEASVQEEDLYDPDTAKQLKSLAEQYIKSTKVGQKLEAGTLTKKEEIDIKSDLIGDENVSKQYDKVAASGYSTTRLNAAVPRIVGSSVKYTEKAIENEDLLKSLAKFAGENRNEIKDLDETILTAFTDPLYSAVNAEAKDSARNHAVNWEVKAKVLESLPPGTVGTAANAFLGMALLMDAGTLGQKSNGPSCPEPDSNILASKREMVGNQILATYIQNNHSSDDDLEGTAK